MKIISHRGNLNGPKPDQENRPEYIEKAIKAKYEVEVDLWGAGDELWLGHDGPQYKTDYEWLLGYRGSLWIHCKNLAALQAMDGTGLRFFFHDKDDYTLTSWGHIWTYPGKKVGSRSVIVLREDDEIPECYGVCTDWPKKVKRGLKKR